MSVTTYLDISYQIQYWTLHVFVGGYICFLYMFLHCKRSSKYTDLVNQYARHLSSWDWGVHLPFPIMNIEQRRGHSVVWKIWLEGCICLWYPYVSICTGISLYFLISWLFRMGCHWWHWTVKSSFCTLAVSNGGYIISFTLVKLTFPYICLWYLYVYICTGISLYILISWPFQMGSYWWHWTAKSSLSALTVLNGGSVISFTWVNLKIWAHLPFHALLHRRSFRITYERPNKLFSAYSQSYI